MRAAAWIAIGGAAVAALAIVGLLRSAGSDIPVIGLTSARTPTPAMCPWREPERDMRAFFPGATGYTTELMALSRLRQSILARLGPGVSLESNALYVHRVMTGSRVRGIVMVRRAPGRYGAIELVLAVDPSGAVAGARIQRQREPREAMAALTDPAWLSAFRGKTWASHWRLGDDIPVPQKASSESASAVVSAARSLLIELDSGSAAFKSTPHQQHLHA